MSDTRVEYWLEVQWTNDGPFERCGLNRKAMDSFDDARWFAQRIKHVHDDVLINYIKRTITEEVL